MQKKRNSRWGIALKHFSEKFYFFSAGTGCVISPSPGGSSWPRGRSSRPSVDDAGDDNYHHQHHRHDAVGQTTGERAEPRPHIVISLFFCSRFAMTAAYASSDETRPHRALQLRMTILADVQLAKHPGHVAPKRPHGLHTLLVLCCLSRCLAISHVPVL